jgi:predicted esterase
MYLASGTLFDGILAFSQGAGLALIYTRYFLHLYPEKPLPFRCLLLFSPVGLSDPVIWLQTGELRKLAGASRPFNIPVAVVVGQHDLPRVKLETEDIQELVQAEKGCWKYVHTGGHDIPNGNAKEELRGTVRTLRRAIAQVQIMDEC